MVHIKKESKVITNGAKCRKGERSEALRQRTEANDQKGWSLEVATENEEKMETDFIFLGSKIIADSDCSQEIKRHLRLGRKVMTNLNSILKSRDITLPTKVHLVKAMVFPVVIYGCESWTIKKTEPQGIDAFEL